MKEHEKIVVGGGILLLLVGWLGFTIHSSPRFAGSAIGSAFGIAGAAIISLTRLFPCQAYPLHTRTDHEADFVAVVDDAARLRRDSGSTPCDHSHRTQIQQLVGDIFDSDSARRRRQRVSVAVHADLRCSRSEGQVVAATNGSR